MLVLPPLDAPFQTTALPPPRPAPGRWEAAPPGPTTALRCAAASSVDRGVADGPAEAPGPASAPSTPAPSAPAPAAVSCPAAHCCCCCCCCCCFFRGGEQAPGGAFAARPLVEAPGDASSAGLVLARWEKWPMLGSLLAAPPALLPPGLLTLLLPPPLGSCCSPSRPIRSDPPPAWGGRAPFIAAGWRRLCDCGSTSVLRRLLEPMWDQCRGRGRFPPFGPAHTYPRPVRARPPTL